MSPACALEQIVKEILDWHRERLGLHDACGAEWWTLWMDGEDDDVGWHWDADYEARERGEVKHPFLGTVTYLDTGSAAPTVIIDDCREQPIMAGAGSVIYSAHLSLPVPGKHICFDGTLLHGAPVELRDMFGYSPPSAGGKRRSARSTLLANIWCSHQPRDPQRLPAEVAAKLSPATVASPFALGSQRASCCCEVAVGRGVSAQEMSWSFGESDVLSVAFPVPSSVSKDADCIRLHFIDGRCGCVGWNTMELRLGLCRKKGDIEYKMKEVINYHKCELSPMALQHVDKYIASCCNEAFDFQFLSARSERFLPDWAPPGKVETHLDVWPPQGRMGWGAQWSSRAFMCVCFTLVEHGRI